MAWKAIGRSDQHDDEQSHGDRRGIATTVLLECLAIHVEQDDHRGVVWSSLSQQIDLIENFELSDQLKEENQARHRPNKRAGDVEELLPPVGPINRRRLVNVRGDVVKSGDKEEHVESHRPPNGHHRPPPAWPNSDPETRKSCCQSDS